MSTVIIIEDPPRQQNKIRTTGEELILKEQLKRDIEALREAGFRVVVHTPNE
jgi:hypothetical protein